MTLRDINEVLEAHTAGLMALPGVYGVAVGKTENGIPCIMVLADQDSVTIGGSIPETLEGHPVRILDSDEIRPMHGD